MHQSMIMTSQTYRPKAGQKYLDFSNKKITIHGNSFGFARSPLKILSVIVNEYAVQAIKRDSLF